MSYRSRLPLIADRLPIVVDEELSQGTEKIALSAEARVAVESGQLKSTIHVERRGESCYLVVAGDNEAFYGHLVENGTSHSAPQPFLVPAFEENRAGLLSALDRRIRRLA